ncbi:MAG: BamA/TamA family outer membrane protein [Bacteroidetes bacterium]|nr:BamA/TamA family outer membrane protein [Bacteroidota bacterium]
MRKYIIGLFYLFLTIIFLYPQKQCFGEDNDGIYIIDEIKVEGNENIPENVFISISSLKKGEIIRLSDTKINQAMNKIWKRHIVNDVSIEGEILSDEKISLLIKVKLGEILTDFNIEGLSEKEEEAIVDKSDLQRGKVITEYFLENIKSNIIAQLSKDGYFYPDIKITKETNTNINNGVSLNIKVTKNKAQKAHKIYFKGNKVYDSDTLKHKMILTKEVRRPSILTRFFKSIFIKVFHKYKSPKDRQVRISYLKDEFFTIYSNLFGVSFKEEPYEADLELHIKRGLYYKNGYIDAAIVKKEFKRHDEQTIDLFVEIYEGPRYVLNSIKWVGNKSFTDKELNKILNVKTNRYYDKDTLERNLFADPENSIKTYYHNRGYLFCNIELETYKIEGNKIDLVVKIDEGKQAIVNNVNISGTKISKDRTIRRYIYTIPTHKYSNYDVMLSKNALGRANIIDTTKFKHYTLPDRENGTVDIEYVLKEKLDMQFQAKLSMAETGFVGTIGGQFNNLALGGIFRRELPFGGGQTGTFAFEKSKSYQKIYFDLHDPWVFNWGRFPIELNFNVWHSWGDQSKEAVIPPLNYDPLASVKSYEGDKLLDIEEGYDGFIKSTGISTTIGKRLSWIKDTTIFSGFSYDHRSFKEILILPQDENRRIGKSIDLNFNIGIKKNNTDSPFFPTQGYKMGLSGILTPPYSLFKNIDPTDISNDYTEYHQWSIHASKYNQLFKTTVLAATFEMGFLGAYSSKYGIGPYRRYHFGGEGQVPGHNPLLSQKAVRLRGYSNGYHVPNSDSGFRGGVIYDKLTFEMRQYLSFVSFMPIYVLLFTEAGNTWAQYDKFDFSEMLGYASYGFGFRAIIPMLGPLGIHFGWKIDKDTKNLSPEIHFSSGIA